MISIQLIKQLREETDVSITECQKALEQTNGDIEKAKEILRKLGKDLAGKKVDRAVSQGLVETYIHPNKKIGVMLEIRCETDFVSKGEQFQKLAHEICLQIAASKPLFIKEEEIPENFLDGERKIYQEQFKDTGKPQKIIDQIIEGKLNKYKQQVLLMSQLWIKDDSKTIQNLIEDTIAKLGENIVIKKFARFEI
ncbi:MAG: translation elongation factor Ts [Patescibacteria group bacterium]|nr:translation elongation factor Ts [Patescibacteria group bacterium]